MTNSNKDWVQQLEPGDYYFIDGRMVFTEQYHIKRGRCCGQGCKNCPWPSSKNEKDNLYWKEKERDLYDDFPSSKLGTSDSEQSL